MIISKTTQKSTIAKLLILTIAFTLALSVNYLFAAWTGPTQAPPQGNTPTPLHVGATDQVKDAGLSLDRLAVFGNGYFSGNLGINETAPATGGEQDLNLDVEGAIGAKYYCDEDGNNCVDGDALGSGGGGGGGGSQIIEAKTFYHQQNAGRTVNFTSTFTAPPVVVVTPIAQYYDSSIPSCGIDYITKLSFMVSCAFSGGAYAAGEVHYIAIGQ